MAYLFAYIIVYLQEGTSDDRNSTFHGLAELRKIAYERAYIVLGPINTKSSKKQEHMSSNLTSAQKSTS